MNCPKCGKSIERRPGRGRPSVYCSAVCRSAAAYEVKRVQRLLGSLEFEASHVRRELALEGPEHPDVYWNYRRRRLGAIAAEIAKAEARLSLLVSETRGTRLALLHERSDE